MADSIVSSPNIQKVNILISNKKNEKMLKDFLQKDYQIELGYKNIFTEVDLIIIDGSNFKTYQDQIKELKNKDTIFVPILFLALENGNIVSENNYYLVEDIVEMPVSKKIIDMKIKNLLRIKKLYSDRDQLQERYSNLFDSLDQLKEISFYDQNSGLPNSSSLIDKTEELIKGKKNIYLILIDITNYQEIISSIGHNRWGKFIKEIGTQLKDRLELTFLDNNNYNHSVSPENFEISLYNIYHNKLGFLIENIKREDLMEVLEQLKENTDTPFYYNKIPIFLSSYIGVASYHKENTEDELLQNAHKAMYTASQKRKKIQFYDRALEKNASQNFSLLGEVRNALDQDQFMLEYLPKIDLKTGKIIGAEALIRWEHPQKGFISPGRFIPQVERTALINQLSLWVFKKAVKEKLLLEKKGINIDIAVNITPYNLQEDNFIKEMKTILKKHALSSGQLELELTETDMMEELKEGKKTIDTLVKEGFKVAMDDFGTGYSSLRYLKNLAFDSIKIDLSFVQEMEKDKNSYQIVKTAISLGHVLDKKVVAEGIENQEVMDKLKKLKCDFGQGYYISKPIAIDDFIQFYNNWRK